MKNIDFIKTLFKFTNPRYYLLSTFEEGLVMYEFVSIHKVQSTKYFTYMIWAFAWIWSFNFRNIQIYFKRIKTCQIFNIKKPFVLFWYLKQKALFAFCVFRTFQIVYFAILISNQNGCRITVKKMYHLFIYFVRICKFFFWFTTDFTHCFRIKHKNTHWLPYICSLNGFAYAWNTKYSEILTFYESNKYKPDKAN